jgi:hypothetical protein
MLVEEEHSRLERDGNLFPQRFAVMWIEDGLSTNTTFGGRSEIEE